MEGGEEKVGAVVVDTNIIISALIPQNSKLRDIILSGKLKLYAPEYLLKELEKYWELIIAKAEKRGVSRSNLELVKEELLSKIIFEPEKLYLAKIHEAYAICKNFDEKDTPFVALSLVLRIPILTGDRSLLKNAGNYSVMGLEELFEMLMSLRDRVSVVKGDITPIEVDAIVNPSNSYGVMGGGVALAIKRSGGGEIEREAMAKAPINVGSAAVTTAGKLKAKAVIHASTMQEPAQRVGVNEVRLATRAALREASKHGFKSIAFPGMGTGVGGVPKDEAARAMLEEIKAHLAREALPERVILVAFDEELFSAFQRALAEVGE
jgi:putative PIN family toxin of toxin-antitoxin system